MYVKVNQEKVYCCYSWRLKDELRRNGFEQIGEDINKTTGKTYWIFPKTNELCEVLKQWTNNKKSN